MLAWLPVVTGAGGQSDAAIPFTPKVERDMGSWRFVTAITGLMVLGPCRMHPLGGRLPAVHEAAGNEHLRRRPVRGNGSSSDRCRLPSRMYAPMKTFSFQRASSIGSSRRSS
ncbi:hypothetical protein GCM10011579_024980 [Streptomyces albiflavescens]|uniref:Uncharacterized protein n=1 Tax=Streptomyces albiflavescens TaxID=1623582 RepID=A0A918D2Q3_9ACTN|nr:hypothetical protein GCM10011579_024980 [Streptomyces albiflavescens]